MISSAKANFQRISPRKARMVVDMVRGLDVKRADEVLQFSERGISTEIRKVLASAVANAKQKGVTDPDRLFVSKATVDQGPNSHLRRWRPRAQGRATPIVKGVSHITIELDQR